MDEFSMNCVDQCVAILHPLGRELLGGEGDVVRSRRNMKCPHVKFVNDLRVHAIIDKLAIVLSHDPTNDQGGFCLIRDLSYVARNELLNGAFISVARRAS
ncbi:MAG: hypothetical protein IIC84_03015 [Chloroflexi bacterium]|nr:hypothetical protein [Chloroflexota bacterium]